VNDDVVERLDLMLAVLQLAHQDAIDHAADQLRADPVNAAILDACADGWVAAGALTKAVLASVEAKDRTVRGRIATLVIKRAIRRRGSGSNVEYKSMGLV
jgi:hypothetical protein